MSNNNRQERQQEIKEDGPEYRSVMMAPPMRAPLPMPRSFAAPPQRKFAAAPSAKETVVLSATKSKIKSCPPSSKWTPAPTAIPVYHFLERTHVRVANCTAEVIASRVSECCRDKSIAALLDDEDCNVLRCETDDCIKFAVRIFKDQEQIVLEVQRMGGCSYSFREISRTVLRAAKNDGSSSTIVKKRNFTIPSSLPGRSMEDRQASVQNELEHALAMIQSERLDSQAMGLESIESMTRSCIASELLAKSVLKHDCLECLFSLLETARKEDDSQTSRKVMAILANALSTLGPAYLAEIVSSPSQLKAESFLSILLSSLRDAAEKPHDACQAARCMQALLVSSEVKHDIMEMRLMEVVESACSAGCNSHMALEQESKKLMAQLRSC